MIKTMEQILVNCNDFTTTSVFNRSKHPLPIRNYNNIFTFIMKYVTDLIQNRAPNLNGTAINLTKQIRMHMICDWTNLLMNSSYFCRSWLPVL